MPFTEACGFLVDDFVQRIKQKLYNKLYRAPVISLVYRPDYLFRLRRRPLFYCPSYQNTNMSEDECSLATISADCSSERKLVKTPMINGNRVM